MTKAFTLIECILVIAIIAILSCVLIPVISTAYEDKKQDIIDIANGVQMVIYDYDTHELIYEGAQGGYEGNYEIVDIDYIGGTVVLYVRGEQ